MDNKQYEVLKENFHSLDDDKSFCDKKIYLFGHCNATELLADLFIEFGYMPVAILDNNPNKYGKKYRNICIVSPQLIMDAKEEECVVCIVSRAYAAMTDQLRRMGFKGNIYKLINYNSFAEYSLSKDTLDKMTRRVSKGLSNLELLNKKYDKKLKIFCPFVALGDVFL